MRSLILGTALAVASITAAGNASAANFFGSAQNWQDGNIPYRINDNLHPDARQNFEEAIQYFESQTLLTLTEVPDGQPLPRRHLIVTQGDGNRANTGFCHFLGCVPARMWLTDGASVATAIHEIGHVFGMTHEHQRADRDDYVAIEAGVDRSDYNWDNTGHIFGFLGGRGTPYGSYDRFSRMSAGYDDLMSPINTAADAGYSSAGGIWRDVLGKSLFNNYDHHIAYRIRVPAGTPDSFDYGHDRGYRILLDDPHTPDNPLDDLGINLEFNGDVPGVNDLGEGWHSSCFEFENLGRGYFAIRSIWQNTYLTHLGPGDLAFTAHTGAEAQQWKLEVTSADNNRFRILSRSSGEYLDTQGTTAGNLSSSLFPAPENSSFRIETIWNRPHGLSLMDIAGLQMRYGKKFHITLQDRSPDTSDDVSANLAGPGGTLAASHVPEASEDPALYDAALFEFEAVETFFRVKSTLTGEYLHNEFGVLDLAASGEINGAGEDVTDWFSAQWELEVYGDHFRFRNRSSGEYLYTWNGQLDLDPQAFDADSNWLLVAAE